MGEGAHREEAEERGRGGRRVVAAPPPAVSARAHPQASPLWSVDGVRAAVCACVQLMSRARRGGGGAGEAVECSGGGGAGGCCASYGCSLHALLCTGGVSSSACPELFPLLLACLPSHPSLASAFVVHCHDIDEGQLVDLLIAALDMRLTLHSHTQSAQRQRDNREALVDVDPLMSASPTPPLRSSGSSLSRLSGAPRSVLGLTASAPVWARLCGCRCGGCAVSGSACAASVCARVCVCVCLCAGCLMSPCAPVGQ